tara:strand:+ start:286 stop:498 length:213 start_codon:yes stop_codon:yes gene_type:complete
MISLGQFTQDAETRVKGTVVNREQFEITLALSQYAADGFGKGIPGISDWEDDGNAGGYHGERRRKRKEAY